MSNFSSEDLEARVASWKAYAEDPNHNPCADQTPGKRWKGTFENKVCDVGDMVLFNSLLCYSGDVNAAVAVRRSQDKNGRWWRSAMHVDAKGNPTNYPGSAISFSKDHVLGVLLYLVTTPDKDTARIQAKAWINYIRTQGPVRSELQLINEKLKKRAEALLTCNEDIILNANGCVKKGEITFEKSVWEKVGDCAENPGDCWDRVKKDVIETFDRAIGFWTHDVWGAIQKSYRLNEKLLDSG